MNPYEIVVGEVQPQSRREALDALREAIGEPRQPTQERPAVQVVPLCVAGRNERQYANARDRACYRHHKLKDTLTLRVALDEHPVIAVCAERPLDSPKIAPQPVRADLRADCQP